MTIPTQYRFADFVVSRTRRQLLQQGRALPLIPRYFDLLVLLIERRQTAVSRREIFDRVWSDVIVSDGALSQAVRTLRRTLGDDSRDPMFIRTVSRHGYSFVFPAVVEESENVDRADSSPPYTSLRQPVEGISQSVDDLIQRLVRPVHASHGDEDQRDAAEQLHLLGTAAAIERLTAQPGHARALALLRDARWDVPGAGAVPLLGQPEGLAAAWSLIRLRTTQAFRMAERRWAAAAAGAATAGALAGGLGGVALVTAATSEASPTAIGVLMTIGAAAGWLGASGVAAGIAAAEAVARSRRAVAIVAGGAAGGLAIGLIGHAAVRWTLEGLFGLRVLAVGGPLEGVTLGTAVALGYAATTRRPTGGMATPVGGARWATAVGAAACCAMGGVLLSLLDRPLVGGLINAIAQASQGSDMVLTPLGSLVGDPSFGPIPKTLLAVLESGLFGFGLAWGLTSRPASE